MWLIEERGATLRLQIRFVVEMDVISPVSEWAEPVSYEAATSEGSGIGSRPTAQV
ncbi:hypothetical protein U91I_00074 [alpha proteobacterium U9-1i]|nr:hypothetical protein U91I_00074 [alpha proteobacterium U9-1i]